MEKDLFIKYLQGTCTETEFEQLLVWLKDKSKTFRSTEMIRQIWTEYEPEAGTEERIKYSRILDKIHHQINISQASIKTTHQRIPAKTKIISILTRVAAILLLPLLLLFVYTHLSQKKQFAVNTSDLEVAVPAGCRMQVVLGDGTKVWLNGESKLCYPYQFEGDEREVKLSGEAFFDVVHNKKIPFIVKTGHLSVKATGTAFNVNAYPEEKVVETTLVEGRVIIIGKDNREVKVLSPNEYLKFNLEKNEYTLEAGNIKKYIAWKDGLLVFKNDPILDVVEKIEHWYNVDIEITDRRVKELTYTATFDNESLSQVLELMALATPVNYKLVPRVKLSDGRFSKQKVLIGLQKQ